MQTDSESLFVRERMVQGIDAASVLGCSVRVLVDGAWGFAAGDDLTAAGVARLAELAVQIARERRGAGEPTRVVMEPLPGRRRPVRAARRRRSLRHRPRRQARPPPRHHRPGLGRGRRPTARRAARGGPRKSSAGQHVRRPGSCTVARDATQARLHHDGHRPAAWLRIA